MRNIVCREDEAVVYFSDGSYRHLSDWEDAKALYNMLPGAAIRTADDWNEPVRQWEFQKAGRQIKSGRWKRQSIKKPKQSAVGQARPLSTL